MTDTYTHGDREFRRDSEGRWIFRYIDPEGAWWGIVSVNSTIDMLDQLHPKPTSVTLDAGRTWTRASDGRWRSDSGIEALAISSQAALAMNRIVELGGAD